MEPQSEKIAQTLSEVKARHQANRRAWNEGAQHYSESNEARVRLLKDGQSSIHAVERNNLAQYGPLSQWCQRAIHLQCASGYDTLSLLVEGAHEVVGVDISDVHIKNAQWTTSQLQWPATWYCCDLLDTPAELNESADLVYTGQGALCWLHDITAWAAVVARLLRPGGLLSLFDDHPASWLFSQDSSSVVAAGLNYFGHAETNQGWTAEYIGDLGKPLTEHALKYERLWTLANIFQALTNAGLAVEFLGEHADEYWNAFPKLSAADKAKLPLTFSLVARKAK
jgi:SAM-dependent methyltransferase